jgi:hypothetical protein
MASRNFYKTLLALDVKKAQDAMSSQFKGEAGKASKQAGRGKIGGTIGGLIGQFGVPALLGAIGVSTGGVGLLALSALGATLGSYVGNKAGQGMGAQANVDAIKRQKFGSDEYNTYQGEIDSQLDQIEDSARADAVKTGAAVGAQGITMGVDKYATYAQNPLGHYFKSFRNPAQLAADKEKALAGLVPGSDEYNKALLKHTKTATSNIVKGSNKTSVLDLVQQTPSSSAIATPKNMSLINTGLNQQLDELIAAQASAAPGPVTNTNANLTGPLYTNLLQAVVNPFPHRGYFGGGIHGTGVQR